MGRPAKFDSADLAAIAKMDAVLLREIQRSDREDRKIFREFVRDMNRAITARQRELAVERRAVLKQIEATMRKHNLTVEEVMA